MKLIKLTSEQYQRSLKSQINHLWLFSKTETTQRTHNNSIFLSKTIGDPFACLVIEYDSTICDNDLKKLFGKDVFFDGAVSPFDKENMSYPIYYIKNSTK